VGLAGRYYTAPRPALALIPIAKARVYFARKDIKGTSFEYDRKENSTNIIDIDHLQTIPDSSEKVKASAKFLCYDMGRSKRKRGRA
jgi:stringent starvation protein B